MKKIILIIFLLFSYQVHADWTSFLSGALQALNENVEKQDAKQKVKGSPEDYATLKKFPGCIQYVEKQSKYDHLNKKPQKHTMLIGVYFGSSPNARPVKQVCSIV